MLILYAIIKKDTDIENNNLIIRNLHQIKCKFVHYLNNIGNEITFNKIYQQRARVGV